MTRRSRDLFETIRTEGGLLPGELLKRVADGDKDLKGLDPDDYHLVKGERLNEVITRSWNRLLGAWASFGDAAGQLAEGAADAGLTRERWLLVLFQELGYGRLSPAKALEIDGKTYPVSHFAQSSPIHLVGFRTDLDTRTKGVAGAARQSPHSMVQEVLNRSDGYLWGFVANGYRLRILRDNVSLTRQAYVEFDIEAMMEGEAYSDFVLLWLLCHQSRVEAEKAVECWLERWCVAGREQGTRVLDRLRLGVQTALEALGRGFLVHPKNADLRDHLRAGNLNKQNFYRELLRLVYRLLFLFVAEDRDLLLDPSAPETAKKRYQRYYATTRLRRLAERRRGGPHGDLYQGLRVVMDGLGNEAGCAALGLPALGSFLWGPKALPDLEKAQIANADFLDAVRALTFMIDEKVLRPIDYRNLAAEEPGSVYESLLELHPEISTEAGTFKLVTVGGHERRATSSYYTSESPVQCQLDSTLNPVLDEAVHQPDPEEALLALKVCDLGCGSGHFLIAAAHRIAKRLAAVRTGDEEPSPAATRKALRDVIGHCIYGVDLNPMAVELCKVSLWMEALEPGKPLSFLEHRVVCGNSLVGATPALIKKGIPDEAFHAIDGDDKERVRSLRRQNKQEREGQLTMFADFVADAASTYGDLSESIATLDAIDDDSILGIHQKETCYRRFSESAEYARAKLIADAWVAAFFWSKTQGGPEAITHDMFRRLCKNPESIARSVRNEVQALTEHYGFLHLHLAFPDVFVADGDSETGWGGGFDAVVGNPPWDAMSPDAKEFFSTYNPEIRFQDRAGQEAIIETLMQEPSIASRWSEHCRDLYAQVHFFKESGRYRLFAPGNLGKGDFNVYRMFVESAFQATRAGGRFAQVVPEGLYNGANCMAIRKAFFEECVLDSILGFENSREVWFRGIDSRAKFCIYSAKKGGTTESFRAAFNIRSEVQLADVRSGNVLTIPVAMVAEFSPDALAIMELGCQLDIDIAQKMYRRWPKFGDASAGEPQRTYMAEVHMGNDRELFGADPSGLPLYEGRMVDQFDYRAKGYRSGRGRAAVWEDLRFGDPEKSIQPQWYVPRERLPDKLGDRVDRYRIGFCDVASPTNERTLVACLIPPGSVCGHKVPTITFDPGFEWAYAIWLAVANSFTMDFLARKKVSLAMSYTLLDSLPFPRLLIDDPITRRLAPLVLHLTCTGPEMIPYWNAMATLGFVETITADGPPPGALDDDVPLRIRAEIEAIVAGDLFGLTREELSYIFETFPIVKRKDIEKYGDFRTKLLILDTHDRMPRAIATGEPYQTVLDPPPGDPRVAHPPRGRKQSDPFVS
jgi:hypothetical protein